VILAAAFGVLSPFVNRAKAERKLGSCLLKNAIAEFYLTLQEDNAMLVLTRKVGEKIQIGDVITITVVEVRGNKIRLGIDAPDHVPVFRSELHDLLAKIGTEVGEPADHELAQAF
jgi:carbon storage regulator